MSSETSAWAKEQRCGDPVTKAVLIEIANWAKPTGICEFLSVKRLAEVVEVSGRTVQRHIARLTDLGMIKRVSRHRDDGGQGANSFELVGYDPPATVGQRPPRQSVTPPRQDDAPPRQSVREGGDNRVTRLGDKILPPSSSNEDEAPAADLLGGEEGETPVKPTKPHRLPDDWSAPPQGDLTNMARALVSTWPSGAYQASCETFRLHWHSETRAIGRKKDWGAALGKWLINDHPKVMRDAKAGVSFAKLDPSSSIAAAPLTPDVDAKGREDGKSAKVHAWLKIDLGERTYDRWLKSVAILMEGDGALVIVGSAFARSWIEKELSERVLRAAQVASGGLITRVRFEEERQMALEGGNNG